MHERENSHNNFCDLRRERDHWPITMYIQTFRLLGLRSTDPAGLASAHCAFRAFDNEPSPISQLQLKHSQVRKHEDSIYELIFVSNTNFDKLTQSTLFTIAIFGQFLRHEKKKLFLFAFPFDVFFSPSSSVLFFSCPFFIPLALGRAAFAECALWSAAKRGRKTREANMCAADCLYTIKLYAFFSPLQIII